MRAAQRDADYTYRLAVDPGPAKELRLFGLVGWTIERFVARRTRLHALQYEATRLREKPMVWSLLIVLAANVARLLVAGAPRRAADASRSAEVVVFAQAAVGASLLAFGGLRWALDGAAAPVAAVLRLEAAMASAGALPSGPRRADGLPAREIRFRDVTFAYPSGAPVLEHFDLAIPAGSSIAIVGQNGAGKTTLAKLLCRLYDPQAGAIEIDGVDLREIDVAAWRARVTAVFQDFIRFELPLRDNVAPAGAPDEVDARGARDRPAPRTSPGSTRSWRAATTAAPISRADNGSASPSRARCAPCGSAPASCCSTSRRRSSTCAARPRSSTASSRRPGSARRSSSRTASPPCATPIASACSSTAASSSSARTTS